MKELKPKTLLEEYPGKVLGYDLQFMAGASAKRTLLFEIGEHPPNKESYSVYVDVDGNNDPVAISFVHHESAPITYTKCQPAQAQGMAEELYDFAKKLVQLERLAGAMHDSLRRQIKKTRQNHVRETATRLRALEALERSSGPVFAGA